MIAILECESSRRVEQSRLDQLKTAKERNQWGQFATPPGLSLEIAEYAWKKLHRREGKFRFLDPAIGTGSFFQSVPNSNFPPENLTHTTMTNTPAK